MRSGLKGLTSLLAMLVLISGTGVLAQSSKNKSKVTNLKSNLKKVESQKAAVRSELKKVRRSASYVVQDIHKVDRQLDDVEGDIDRTRARLRVLNAEKVRLENKLKKAEQELKEQTEVMRVRIRRIFMQSEGSALGALLSSESIGDLAARKAILSRIADDDRETFDEFQAVCETVRVEKKKKEGVISETHELVASLKEKEERLQAHRKLKKGLLSELQEQTDDLEAQYRELDRESNAIESQIAKYQAQFSGGPAFGGRFIKPTSGRITSGFGSRRHPILRKTRMHTGIDFGAPYGSAIWASAPGTVISAGYRGGYGNTVIIDHGGGVATLYGHMSRVMVSSGQRVRQGQRIGSVGSTGLSTGPHLHFEVRVNGKPVNPSSRI